MAIHPHPTPAAPTSEAPERAALLAALREGLAAQPRRLPSSLLYDAAGSALFEQITRLPEYYLTRTELAILQAHGPALAAALPPLDQVVELGAGSGLKTVELLRPLLARSPSLAYVPIDISQTALDALGRTVAAALPSLAVQPLVGDYFTALAQRPAPAGPTLALFLGSTIGNFDPAEAEAFLRRLRGALRPGDALLMGFDLKKDPRRLQAAYDDPAGLTARFNLNLLERLNRDAGTDFHPGAWVHHELYDPVAGAMVSYLLPRQPQTVHLPTGEAIAFEAWEPLCTEFSYKFSVSGIAALGQTAGFGAPASLFTDPAQDFADALFVLR